MTKCVATDVAQEIEPEQRKLREYLALIRNAGGQYVVEGGDPVGGDEEQVVPDAIDIADFAFGIQF